MYKIRPLNLPPFHVKLREEGLKNQIFDPIRQKYVALTPEEWVRQHFVNYLTEYLEYPKGMIANEVMIRLNGTEKRCDTIVYSSSLQPLLIVEYKAPSVGLSKRVLEQIIRYNMVLHVRFLVVSNGLKHFCCEVDYDEGRYHPLREIPPYKSLEF